MYRFRSLESLLGEYKELENQEIYFASPEQLNDALEGYMDVFWKGDEIIWKNFIINYTKSLTRFYIDFLVHGDMELNLKERIKVNQDLLIDQTPFYKELEDSIINTVRENKHIKEVCINLSQREILIRYTELSLYIIFIHMYILKYVSIEFFNKGLAKDKFFDYSSFEDKIKLSDIIKAFETQDESSEAFDAPLYQSLLNTIMSLNNTSTSYNNNLYFLMMEFPSYFLEKLQKTIFPNWYSASFLEENTNSAIWGHYGSNHTGVCLEFNFKEGDNGYYLPMKNNQGKENPITLKKINYINKHEEVDFFKTIGRLEQSELEDLWYKDSNGNLSSCGSFLSTEEGITEYRKYYWDKFDKISLIKLDAWAYEKEWRLKISDWFEPINNRKFKYNFEDLKSITFGIKTPNSKKKEIIDIVRRKCAENNREKFTFYQAYYSSKSGEIKTYELPIIIK